MEPPRIPGRFKRLVGSAAEEGTTIIARLAPGDPDIAPCAVLVDHLISGEVVRERRPEMTGICSAVDGFSAKVPHNVRPQRHG